MCFTDRDLGVIRGFGRVGTDKLFHLVHEIQGGLDEGGEAYWRGQRAWWGLVMVESGPLWGGAKMAALKAPSPGTAVFSVRSSSQASLLPRAVLSVVLVCLARRPSKEGLM